MSENESEAYPFIVDLSDGICTSLSILGSLTLFYLCFRLPSPKSQSVKFILSLAVVDLIYAITNAMSFFEDRSEESTCETLCVVEAILRGFSFFLSIFYATCIGIVCLKCQFLAEFTITEFFLRHAHAIGFMMCTILYIILPVGLPQYIIYETDYDYSWVQYHPDLSNIQKVFVLFILEGFPIFMGILITLRVYLLAIRELKELPRSVLQEANISLYKLLLYPALIFIIFIPLLADNIVNIFRETPVWLKALHFILTSSVGFINALVYIFQRGLYHRVDKFEKGRLTLGSARSLSIDSDYDHDF